jgi:hypothetical protein
MAAGSASGVQTGRATIGSRAIAGWLRWGDGVRIAARVTLGHPELWPLALLGFLVRGGIVLFVFSVVTPPSPVGLANIVGPTAVTANGLNPAVIPVLAAIVVGGVVTISVATAIGSWADATVTTVTTDDRTGAIGAATATMTPPTPINARLLETLVAVRIVIAIPLAVVAALVVRSIVEVTYDQLVLPSDLAVPLAWRVARDAAMPVAVVLVAWQLAEIVGGIAARRAVLYRESTARAVWMAFRHVVRHPTTTLATALLGDLGLLAALIPTLVGIGLAGGSLNAVLAQEGLVTVAGLVSALFVAVWLGGLLLTAVASVWRSVLWSVEIGRLPR